MKVEFTAILEKFGKKGEKSGWTYIAITPDLAAQLNPGVKKEYKVKGLIDQLKIEQCSVIPMGQGEFIMPLNADKRKALKKKEGQSVKLSIEPDKSAYQFDQDFMDCLQDDEAAQTFFNSLTGSHQRYFSKWISSAKTEPTKAKRIAMALRALSRGWGYPEMIRENKS